MISLDNILCLIEIAKDYNLQFLYRSCLIFLMINMKEIKSKRMLRYIKSEEKDAKVKQKISNEVDAMKFILAAGKEYWQQVLNWGVSRGLLSDMERSILRIVINIWVTGRTPSEKQAKVVIRARERMIAEGMPMQF
jgi:hypothetical protein